MPISDRIICTLLKDRKIGGLEMLFTKYYKPLVLWSDTFLNNIPQAEDLVQDFFIKLWEKELCTTLLPESLKSYLYTAIKNHSLNHIVKHDPLKKAYNVKEIEQKWDEYDNLNEEILQKIETVIEKLPPRSREVIKRVYQKGMSYREVAEELGVSIATVKTLLVNSLKKIREETLDLNRLFLLLFVKKN